MFQADLFTVRLLDVVTVGLEPDESREVDTTEGQKPALRIERLAPDTFAISQDSETGSTPTGRKTCTAYWRHTADKTWVLLAVRPFTTLDSVSDRFGALAIFLSNDPNAAHRLAFVNTWLGLRFPIQQGGWFRICDAVNRSRST